MTKWFYLLIGSMVGGACRYVLATCVYKQTGTAFPYGTLLVNLSGCFLIGLFQALSEDKLILGATERLLLMTGFCGAYTTFSALVLETSNLLQAGEALWAGTYIVASVAMGLVFFRLGLFVVKVF